MNFENLEKVLSEKGYVVSCFETAGEAATYLASQVHNKTIGFGGSVTLQEMGLYEKLSCDNKVFWHNREYDGLSPDDVRAKANAAQIYFSSVNALAQTGEIINIDGACNRVSSICYGHEKVYLVAGKNKIAPDYDSALFRARNVAAPKNAMRLGKNTPCAIKADKCYNCNSSERICRVLSVWWSKPMLEDVEVVLINENLGF